MGNNRAYVALSEVPGVGGGGGGGQPPPPPPGYDRYFFGTSYGETSYSVSAQFNVSAQLVAYQNGFTSASSTGTSVSLSLSSGYASLYVLILSTSPRIQSLTVESSGLVLVDTSLLSSLSTLDVSDNQLTSVTLNSRLTDIDIKNNDLTSDIVNNILLDLISFGESDGLLDATNTVETSEITEDITTNKETLEADGWTILGLDVPFAASDSFSGVGEDSGVFQDDNFNTRFTTKVYSPSNAVCSISGGDLLFDSISGNNQRSSFDLNLTNKLPTVFEISLKMRQDLFKIPAIITFLEMDIGGFNTGIYVRGGSPDGYAYNLPDEGAYTFTLSTINISQTYEIKITRDVSNILRLYFDGSIIASGSYAGDAENVNIRGVVQIAGTRVAFEEILVTSNGTPLDLDGNLIT